jgi:hypothetical protein
MHPYQSEGKVLLDVQSVIPIPEIEDYQVKIREKHQKERASRESTRDRSRYSIYFDGEEIYSRIRKSDIGFSSVQLLNDKGLIDQSTFEFLRADRTCTFQLLKMKPEVTANEEKYSKYRVSRDPELTYGENSYYIARNWGKESAVTFSNKVSAKFP